MSIDTKSSSGSSTENMYKLMDEKRWGNTLAVMFSKWEFILVILLVFEVILFSNLTPHFLNTF